MKLPRLAAKPPARPVRLTLQPHEAVLLWEVLEKQLTSLDAFVDANPTHARVQELRAVSDVLWELEGRLSDKLTFSPAENGVSGS